MLSVAEDHLRELNPDARLEVFGQELNAETYAICRSDMMLKGQDASNIAFGNCFTEDGHAGRHVRLPARQPAVRRRVEEGRGRGPGRGTRRRASPAASGPGCRGSTTARFLFLQHMISKMKPVEEGGSRLAIVFNGSPLFTGAAGSGESEIRRWIIENDWLEAVVALPDQLFYNTGISTYFWIVTNRKTPRAAGQGAARRRPRAVRRRCARASARSARRSPPTQIDEITRLYGDFAEGDQVKIFPNEAFGFLRITVERPLRLRWEVTDDTLAAVDADTKVAKLARRRADDAASTLARAHRGDASTEPQAAGQGSSARR